MYKGRIKSWKLLKNVSKDDKLAMLRKVRHGGAINQTLPNGRPILHRLLRYCKENKVSPATLAMNIRDGRLGTSRNISASRELHSYFESAFQPARPIAFCGTLRAVEISIRILETYLVHYFAEGLGSRYYKKKFLGGSDSQAYVLATDRQACQDLLSPRLVYNSIIEASSAIRSGFIKAGFRKLHNTMDCFKSLFKQQSPLLISKFLLILLSRDSRDTKIFQMIKEFVLGMASTVLRETHPLNVIAKELTTLSNVAEQCYVWRALTEMMVTPFSLLEDSSPLTLAITDCVVGLTGLDSKDEASNYLDSLFAGRLQRRQPEFLPLKGRLLFYQGRNSESIILLRECLDIWKVDEQDILAAGEDSVSCSCFPLIFQCITSLAGALEELDEIDAAKACNRRLFNLTYRATGPESLMTQICASAFGDFLAFHDYLEEKEAFEEEYPAVLTGKEIPKGVL
jgi:hypothetical protein